MRNEKQRGAYARLHDASWQVRSLRKTVGATGAHTSKIATSGAASVGVMYGKNLHEGQSPEFQATRVVETAANTDTFEDWAPMLPSLFVQIFAWHIVFGYLTGANFLPLASPGLFDARYHPRLEGVAFLHQLVHTFGIDILDVG